MAPIKGCKSLAGKPKIFIFQACRGSEFDSGIETFDSPEVSEAVKRRIIPIEADYLYAYSTVPGYYAWRNKVKGSWFVQALHELMKECACRIDFVKLLTRVNYKVASEFESKGQVKGMKQIPSIVSMLTKDLYFTDKNSGVAGI